MNSSGSKSSTGGETAKFHYRLAASSTQSSSTLTSKLFPLLSSRSVIKNREPWFSTIPASSSSDEETVAE
jgi:hypothetical protein